MSNRSGEHTMVKRTAEVAALALVAGFVVQIARNHECMVDLMHKDVTGAIGCAFDDWNGGSSGAVHNIGLKDEKIIDTALIVGFGTISIKMAGDGTFKYDGSFWKNFPGLTDAEIYYNKGEKDTTQIDAIPCTTLGKDYATALDPSSKDLEPAQPQNTIGYRVDPSADPKLPPKITINAGTLDLCAAHVANTVTNKYMWSNRSWSLGPFGDKEKGTYSYMMDDLLTSAAMAQSCPESKLKMDKVKAIIADVMEGIIEHRRDMTDSKRADIQRAYATPGYVKVLLQDPAIRQAHYMQVFEKKRDSYMNKTRTFPDRNGKTYPMKIPVIDNIKRRSCTVSTLSGSAG